MVYAGDILRAMLSKAHRFHEYASATVGYVRTHALILVVTLTTIGGSVAYFTISPSYVQVDSVKVFRGGR